MNIKHVSNMTFYHL